MNRNSCQNLIAVIQKLQTLQRRVDLANNAFEPEEGLRVKEEAIIILDQYLIERFFKKDVLDYFIEELGSKEEVKKRIFYTKTTGWSGERIKKKLKASGVDFGSGLDSMFQSSNFKIVSAGKRIPMICLQVRDLFSDTEDHPYWEISDRAKELGLVTLPHEIAADLFLSDNDKFKEPYRWFTVFSKSILAENDNRRVFRFGRGNAGMNFDYSMAGTDYRWAFGRMLIMGLQEVNSADANE
jgi:hypothetical protein